MQQQLNRFPSAVTFTADGKGLTPSLVKSAVAQPFLGILFRGGLVSSTPDLQIETSQETARTLCSAILFNNIRGYPPERCIRARPEREPVGQPGRARLGIAYRLRSLPIWDLVVAYRSAMLSTDNRWRL